MLALELGESMDGNILKYQRSTQFLIFLMITGVSPAIVSTYSTLLVDGF
jgi:hypothetical protein